MSFDPAQDPQMTILIAGANGMLGRDLQAVLAGTSHTVTALGRDQLDITDLDAVQAASAGHDVIINAAAYTKVDDAESDEDTAYAINATGAGNLATAAAENGALLVQVSTDYVFDGSATTPYSETEPVHPVSAYGRTKAEGERLAMENNPGRTHIVRTAWIYGENGSNFVKTMLRLGRERDTVSVVTDQVGQPTWTVDLARRIVELIEADAPAGIYHGTNSGEASWFDFTREIFRLSGLNPDSVLPTDSATFVRPAPRPAFSVLGHDAWGRAGFSPMRPWKESLAEAIATTSIAQP